VDLGGEGLNHWVQVDVTKKDIKVKITAPDGDWFGTLTAHGPEWMHEKIRGQGQKTYSVTGEVYVGQWRDGKRHGNGKLMKPENSNTVDNGIEKKIYEGQWRDDNRHGFGRQLYKWDDSPGLCYYEGEWFEDKKHGQGRELYNKPKVRGDRGNGPDVEVRAGRWEYGDRQNATVEMKEDDDEELLDEEEEQVEMKEDDDEVT